MGEKTKLSKNLTLGQVHLYVKNLALMKEFYHEIVGLDIVEDQPEFVRLGKKSTPLIVLSRQNQLPTGDSTEAGLYHFALLFSSQNDLARTIQHILKQAPQFFSGSADHLVSEAFYFYDPEGNGIELYFDRDRSLWKWENNHVQMATLYIDPQEYIERYIVLEKKQSTLGMGHIHLKVGDIEKAKAFYVDVLGFDITAQLPGALFVSVGGYHHHIGLNTWESYGATERSDTLGLKQFELILQGAQEIEDLKQRLTKHHIKYEQTKSSITFFDPWHNQLLVSSHKE